MATIPNPPTFTVSQKLTAALMNTNVRDAVNFLTSSPLCVVTHSTTQTLNTATGTPIVFDTEATDIDNMHSIVSNTSRLTAVTPGYYVLTGHIPFASNATGSRHAWISVNAAVARIAWTGVPAINGLVTSVGASGTIFLNAGDYAELWGYQTSGAGLATDNAAGGSRFSALWVHS